MASIQVNLFSKSLMRVVPVHVLLPVDKLEEPGTPPRENKPYKTLYLLHGIFGNHMDWGMLARVQALSEAYDLAIVMPSGENAFYVDQPKSHNMYGEFIGKELVELATQKTAQVVETQKLRFEIVKTRNQLQKQYEALGKTYYRSLQEPSDQAESLTLLADQIGRTKQQLSQLKQQLQEQTRK